MPKFGTHKVPYGPSWLARRARHKASPRDGRFSSIVEAVRMNLDKGGLVLPVLPVMP